jgi:aryl-alcohol dehydrogenase-like predicted oxidoreductase
MGHNEMLIREALAGRQRDGVVISVKFGALRDAAGTWLGHDTRPDAAKNFLSYSLRRLGVDHIDIYRPSRLDPSVPIEDTIGTLADMVKAGYVRHIGLSEVGAATIRRAAAVHPISDLQIEYSLISRRIEEAILPTCRELGIGITAYGVLSRGLISGHWSKARGGERDTRTNPPRFQGANLEANLALVEKLWTIADELGATVAHVAIAWVAAQGSDILPLVGARRRDRLAEALGALDLRLTAGDLAALAKALPPGTAAGERYPAAAFAQLDSEKKRARCLAPIGCEESPHGSPHDVIDPLVARRSSGIEQERLERRRLTGIKELGCGEFTIRHDKDTRSHLVFEVARDARDA